MLNFIAGLACFVLSFICGTIAVQYNFNWFAADLFNTTIGFWQAAGLVVVGGLLCKNISFKDSEKPVWELCLLYAVHALFMLGMGWAIQTQL